MKAALYLASCLQLAVPSPLLLSSASGGYLSGQVSGFQPSDLAVVDLRFRFYAQRSGGEPLGERVFLGVELMQGRFSVDLDTTLEHRSLVFVEVGLRPSSRHYALFTTLAPRRPLRPGATMLALGPTMGPFPSNTMGRESELVVVIRSHQQARS